MRTSLKNGLCTMASFAALIIGSAGAVAQSSSDYTTAPTDWRTRCEKTHTCDHAGKPLAGTPAACADSASGQGCAGKSDQPK